MTDSVFIFVMQLDWIQSLDAFDLMLGQFRVYHTQKLIIEWARIDARIVRILFSDVLVFGARWISVSNWIIVSYAIARGSHETGALVCHGGTR